MTVYGALMRMVAGKCMMDRNVPQELRDTARTGYDESKALIGKWHGKERLLYAITPRWAGSRACSSHSLLGRASRAADARHAA